MSLEFGKQRMFLPVQAAQHRGERMFLRVQAAQRRVSSPGTGCTEGQGQFTCGTVLVRQTSASRALRGLSNRSLYITGHLVELHYLIIFHYLDSLIKWF
jgi:hypothetical protein